MPLYEYACSKCGEIEEVMQKIADPPPTKCPKCNGRKMERLISRSSFQLKGGGWYSEGYGSKKSSSGSADSKAETSTTASTDSKPAAKTETKSESKAETKSEAKAETKPAPKAEAKATTTKASAKKA